MEVMVVTAPTRQGRKVNFVHFSKQDREHFEHYNYLEHCACLSCIILKMRMCVVIGQRERRRRAAFSEYLNRRDV